VILATHRREVNVVLFPRARNSVRALCRPLITSHIRSRHIDQSDLAVDDESERRQWGGLY